MPRLQPCPDCGRHVRARITTCPHCQATLGSPSVSPRGAALGLALASTVACSGGVVGEPEYGAAYVPEDISQHDDTGDTADSGGEEEGGEEGEEGEEGGEAGEEGGEAGEEGGEEGGETSGESDYGVAAFPDPGDAPSETD